MSGESGLGELKQVLRSLVVSSPTQVDVRSLLRDYRALVGKPLPTRDYGYTDAEQFLRQHCSDCFLFQGASNPVLTLIVPKQLKHIDAHVQKQKVASSSKFKGKRRSIPEGAVRTPNKTQNSKTSIGSNNEYFSDRTPIKTQSTFHDNSSGGPNKDDTSVSEPIETQATPDYKQITGSNKGDYSIRTSFKTLETIEDKPYIGVKRGECYVGTPSKAQELDGKTSKIGNSSIKSHERIYDNLAIGLKKEKFTSECNLPQISDVKSSSTRLKKRETSSEGGRSRQAELEQLKQEVRHVIASSADGVSLTDLMRLYREQYGRELSAARVGLASVLSVVGLLGAEVAVAGGPAGWRARLALPAPDTPAPAPRPAPRPAPARPLPAAPAPRSSPCRLDDDDDALPVIDFEADVFPADCMHYLESVAGAALADWQPGALLPVIVGEVYSPSHFWLLRLGPQHYAALDALMDDMNEYYSSEEGRGRSLALGAVRVGHHCAALFEGDWHRALIVRVLDCDSVKVRHVDWGTVETVRAAGLRPLLRRWGGLPAQAVRARLAQARPPAAARRWPLASCDRFLRIVRDKRLVAEVVAVDHEEEVVEVALVDTSTEEDVAVAAELVRAGYADARAEPALRTGECYLHPSFEALESGATPNYAEIHAYLRDGIALEFVEDYRRHVPTALPPAAAPPPPPRSPSPAPSPVPTPPPPSSPPPSTPAPVLVQPQTGLEVLNRVPLPLPTRSPPHTPLYSSQDDVQSRPQLSCPEPPRPQFASPPPRPPPGFSLPPGFTGPPGFGPPSFCYTERMMCPMFPPFAFGPPFGFPQPISMAPPAALAPPARAAGVQLSGAECETFRLLSAVDARAAHSYMLRAVSRALAPRSSLNPAAQEFRLPPPRP